MHSKRLSPMDAMLWRLGLFVAIAFLLSSTMPEGLVAASFAALSQTGALVAAMTAIFLREKPFAPRVTRWDEAAVLFLVGGLSGLFADTEKVAELLMQHGYTAE